MEIKLYHSLDLFICFQFVIYLTFFIYSYTITLNWDDFRFEKRKFFDFFKTMEKHSHHFQF